MWLIYALGGGWGHLTRAVALASIAQRERPVRVLTNSAYAPIVASAIPTLDLVTFDPCAPADDVRQAVQREIAESRPECLIVDTFPRGIGGELAAVLSALDACRILVHRDLNPRYVEAVGLREFVAAHYDLVIVPGAGEGSQLGDLPMAVETDAWLVRSANEIPGRTSVERYVLICAAGKNDELDWYAQVFSRIRELAPGVPVRIVAADPPAGCPEECWIRYWPAMDLFGCAAVVIGGAGYNTIRECLAWRVPLVAKPWPRLYDRQDLRARSAAASGDVTVVETADDAARSALRMMRAGPPDSPAFTNGAADAVRRIAQACRPYAETGSSRQPESGRA